MTVIDRVHRACLWTAPSATLAVALLAASPAQAQTALGNYGGDLIISSSSYTDPGFSVGAALPIDTAIGSGTSGTSNVNATAASTFCTTSNCSGNVWNNDSVDANFGIGAAIYLQAVNPNSGAVADTVNVTQLAANEGINLVTSFSSKSELALNLTPDGTGITFMGYDATAGELDISNSNTPSTLEPGNTDIQTPTYRSIGLLNLSTNALTVTETNAYNGNNGRAAIYIGNGQYYTVGNAGNGNGSAGTTANTGVQLVTSNGVNGGVGTNVSVGQFDCSTQAAGVCSSSDKTPKDNNFRGETLYNGTLYVSKGSGSNGINTVYQVGASGAALTSAGIAAAASGSDSISILSGLNSTVSAKSSSTPHPFGIWFANSTTMYVTDEGSGTLSTDFSNGGTNSVAGTTYTPTSQAGGLEKWSLVNGTWVEDYELQGALIGSTYTVNGTGSLAGDSLTTTVDGLRNLTGTVNANGTVTLYAVTSTAGSLLGDSGADPNEIVEITDTLADTTATQASGENYTVLDQAALGQVYRGVALAPVPLPPAVWFLLSGIGGMALVTRRRARTELDSATDC